MTTIRDQIKNYLEENQTSSAINLANLLNVTIANIRYHLKFLQNEGVVEIITDVNTDAPGRPTHIYALSKNERSTGIDVLIRSTLEEISLLKNKLTRDTRLKKLAKIIAGKTGPRHPSLTIQLGFTVTRLIELGYKARWEAHSDSPNILLQNCPYSSYVDSFPILCQLDHEILGELLGIPVYQSEKLVSFQDRHPHCRFTTE